MKIYRKRHGTAFLVRVGDFDAYIYESTDDTFSPTFDLRDLGPTLEWLPVLENHPLPPALWERVLLPFRPK